MNFEKLDLFIKKIKDDGCPFYGIKVVKDGKEVYENVFGKRKDGTNADYDDLFFMYSASKVITAVSAMQLVEKGKISLDDPVGNYIPEFKKLYAWESRVPIEKTLTIRHLLTMTGGFNYNLEKENIKEIIKNKNASTIDVVKAIGKDYVENFPGDMFCYGLGLDILGAVIEVVSGMKFAEYVEKNIFEPLDMKNSTFRYNESLNERILPQYWYDDKEKAFKLAHQNNNFIFTDNYESGGAGLIGNINDYIKFVKALANYGVAENGYKLLSKESIDAMKTNHLVSEELMRNFFKKDSGYGYGLGVRTLIDNSKTGAPLGEFGWDSAACAYVLVDVENNVGVFIGCHTLGWGEGYQHHVSIRDLVYECLDL